VNWLCMLCRTHNGNSSSLCGCGNPRPLVMDDLPFTPNRHTPASARAAWNAHHEAKRAETLAGMQRIRAQEGQAAIDQLYATRDQLKAQAFEVSGIKVRSCASVSPGTIHIEAVPLPVTKPAPDPLDKMVEGHPLRWLLGIDERARRENVISQVVRVNLSPAQREAVSTYWSAQLRAKVAASDAAAKERDRRQVVLEADPEDWSW
jgi:hypothetical protein